MPKRIAMRKTEAVAKFTMRAVCAVAAVFRPVIWLLSRSTDAVLRLLHIDPRAEAEDVSVEDILIMVDLGVERGAIKPLEKELIEYIFRFRGAAAGDVAVRRAEVEDLLERLVGGVRDGADQRSG